MDRGVKLQAILNVCPWCNRELERADHLFFNCNFIVGFWRRIFNWWDVGWKVVNNFEEFYLLCFKVKFFGSCKSLWLIAIAASCWSIWVARNDMVFENKVLSMDTLIFHSKMMALLWVRVAFDECMFQERLWWFCPNNGIVFEGALGGGSVMRDDEGIVRALFSSPSDACDAKTAELGAIITTLDVFIEIGWKGSSSLIVEMATFTDFERRIVCVAKLSFSLAKLNGNEMADTLAIARMSRPCLFKAWW
ncbi:hypothetical protein ES288_A08G021800v1 [Gossypium darwinii]|uniref:Reverse transcriptase zinc-binding domain-containing protein n=1 Tax=Gossypium darwinii TaxID=34276 RepID=A0A5D2FGY7_GOSDA|nr:hypothetical protein ES288_A08G021800v1 [Gossypium darwinii]